MDTFITLTAYGKNADAVLKEAENKMAELESLWSVTDEKVRFLISTTVMEMQWKSVM